MGVLIPYTNGNNNIHVLSLQTATVIYVQYVQFLISLSDYVFKVGLSIEVHQWKREHTFTSLIIEDNYNCTCKAKQLTVICHKIIFLPCKYSIRFKL